MATRFQARAWALGLSCSKRAAVHRTVNAQGSAFPLFLPGSLSNWGILAHASLPSMHFAASQRERHQYAPFVRCCLPCAADLKTSCDGGSVGGHRCGRAELHPVQETPRPCQERLDTAVEHCNPSTLVSVKVPAKAPQIGFYLGFYSASPPAPHSPK